MCESKIYIKENKKKKIVMEEAAKIMVDNRSSKIKVYGILGNLEEIDNCEIDVIDLMNHEIILKKK